MPSLLRPARALAVLAFVATACLALHAQLLTDGAYARDPKQPVDQAYTAKIHEYTTAPNFNSPLVDYLPAAPGVPTPATVLGDIAGAPNMLPYAEDTYRYFRALAAASPRVRVVTIGHTEEGREMIAVAVADEALLKHQEENDARLARLANPRTLMGKDGRMDDAAAQTLIDASVPVYYITGTIHSTETGAPTALMELAYRLAVDDAPYIRHIRSHMITLITPVVEVDGRDRMVDLYKWHRAHPDGQWPRLMYWGHYVAHDNNRDAMAMTLNLTRNVMDTYIGWHAQVLHDLHESVPFLYDNTIGDGPYNAWIDPILADEWQELGWNNVAQMQGFGMPGVFTHGDFDTWSAGYLMSLATLHNGIARLYETFGNGGADTEKRLLQPEEYARTWYRQNPPLPVVTWSQRDNNNYEQTALLSTLSYFSQHGRHFLENFYTKSKRSILKPLTEGPVAYVFPADADEHNRQLQLLEVLRRQHVEIQQLTAETKVTLPAKKPNADAEPTHGKESKPGERAEATPADRQQDAPSATPNDSDKTGKSAADADAKSASKAGDKPVPKPTEQTFPAGSFVIRMDQPYSRAADALLDKQFWAPDDPQKHPYDDTGWSFPALFNVKVTRVIDASLLQAPMHPFSEAAEQPIKPAGSGPVFAIANTGQTTLLALVYKLGAAHVSITEKPFEATGQKLPAGSLIVTGVAEDAANTALAQARLTALRIDDAPKVASHPASAPRVAMMHTWLSTQSEGWWRLAFDQSGVPFSYISTQTVAAEPDLRAKYDVIVFAPVAHVGSQQIIDGTPMYGNAMPWQTTGLTPNLGKLDTTPDVRPGLGYPGVDHLKRFVEQGGLLITCEDTAQFAIDTGMAPGVSVASHGDARVVGSVLQTAVVAPQHPVAWGQGAVLPVISDDGMAFNVSNTVGRGGGRPPMDPAQARPTGRGLVGDDDVPQGRAFAEAPAPLPTAKPWEPRPLNEEQTRNNPSLIPALLRPEVILRFAAGKDLLVSGLLDKPGAIAEHAIVVDAHLGSGNVLLFANNPLYRGETVGSYPLVFNAILNWDHLGRQAAAATPAAAAK